MSNVVFRLFTGPHMGAELVLEPGEFVLGSSADCDIVLQDSSVAPRHLRLLVEGQPTVVRVLPLAGQAVIEGKPLAANAQIPPRTPCFVGLSCLAWASTETSSDARTATESAQNHSNEAADLAASGVADLRAAWEEVSEALHTLLHPASVAEDTEFSDSGEAEAPQTPPSDAIQSEGETSAKSSPEADSADKAANNVLKVDGSTANDIVLNRLPAISAQRSGSRCFWRVAILFVLVLALSGLIFKAQEELNRPAQSIEQIKEILKEAGFSALEVSAGDKGPVVSGRLADDRERGRLVRLVQRMHLPVYLNVQVDGDMVQALLTAFNSRELFPKIWAEREEEQINLHVSGYMKDGVVEAWALAGAREDLSWLGSFLQEGTEPSPGKLIRSILHADGVDPVLRSALDSAGLTTQINYLPGTVEISGIFDVEARNRLNRALEGVLDRLGVPVVFQVRESLPALPQNIAGKTAGMHPETNPQAQRAAAPAVAPKSPSAFRVTGVTMTPMRFITLESGERIFEGGMLPGGYTLESISPSQLMLRRDGHTTPLTLRGSNE